MIITIDTKKDSSTDLKAAISLLQSLIKDSSAQVGVSTEGASAFGAMFSDESAPKDDNDDEPNEPVQSASIEMY